MRTTWSSIRRSRRRLDELIGLLDLPPEPHVLDIGCGTGELLVRLAEAGDTVRGHEARGAGFHGVGVDASPQFLARAREAVAQRAPRADIELLEMDGADYAAEAASFDLACCVGASWIFRGHRGTLRGAVGAPRGRAAWSWSASPSGGPSRRPEYLDWSGMAS